MVYFCYISEVILLKKSEKISFALLGMLAVGLMAVALQYDLALDHMLFSPKNPFAIIMEAFCFWPLYLPFALLGAVWANLYTSDVRRILGDLFVVLTFGGLLFLSLPNLAERGLTAGYSSPLAILLIFVLTLTAIKLAGRCGKGTLLRLEFFAKFGIVFCIANNAIINLMKLLWTRMRYDDMAKLGDFSSFTPWVRFGEVAGNTSFPSGHTAAACGILLLLLLPRLFAKLRGKELALIAICYGYIALSGFARMVIGRHYLSDTVAAAIIVTLLFFLLTSLPAFRKRLKQTNRKADDAA